MGNRQDSYNFLARACWRYEDHGARPVLPAFLFSPQMILPPKITIADHEAGQGPRKRHHSGIQFIVKLSGFRGSVAFFDCCYVFRRKILKA